MIKEFSCTNFRNIKVNKLNLEKINLLIGPNNSGKTNFIKALSFFANMIITGHNNSLQSSFLAEVSKNNWNKLINKYSIANSEVNFEWGIKLNDKEVDYRFSFVGGNDPKDFFITREELDDKQVQHGRKVPFNFFRCHTERNNTGIFSTAYSKGELNKRVEIEMSNQDTVLAQFKDKIFEKPNLYNNSTLRKGTFPILEEMQKYFKGFYSYSSSQFDLSKIRMLSDTKEQGVVLNKDGSNFTNVLNYYISKDIYVGQLFDEKLKELLPTLTTTRLSNEFDKFIFRMGYSGKQFDLSDVSDGTIKAMLLTMLIFIPINEGFSLLAIDEPEMNLHPAWQKIIGKWVQLSTNFGQCFISTHSPDLLDAFTDGFINNLVGLYVFNADTNDIVKVKYEDIKSELDGWQLGDLYRSNEPLLGGWPW